MTKMDNIANFEEEKMLEKEIYTEKGEEVAEKSEVVHTVYKSRWYILAIYACFANLQACIFNTWGPIVQSAKVGLSWTDADVAWMGNAMLITSMITVPFSYKILHKWGLRNTVVWSGAGALALGAAIRCISLDGDVLFWTSLLCASLNGWSSIMIECTLTVLSVSWFPTTQRTTATGIVIGTQMAGLVPPSLLFPRIVTEPSFNCTPQLLKTSNDSSCNTNLSSIIQSEISSILYTEATLTGLVFLAMAIYFPSGPPSPPSFSATAERHDIKEGLKHILTTPRCITTGVAFACITVPMMWITVINQNLNPLGLTQEDTGYIGAAIIISSFIMNLVNSSLSDFFFGYLKTVICVFLAISFSFATWLALLCLRMVPLSKSYVYISSITCMVALRSIIALFYELLMEVHYPAPESLTCLLWGQLGRIISAIFLGMFNLPESVLRGFTWMNYFLVTFTVLPLLLLLASKVQYKRSLHDSKR